MTISPVRYPDLEARPLDPNSSADRAYFAPASDGPPGTHVSTSGYDAPPVYDPPPAYGGRHAYEPPPAFDQPAFDQPAYAGPQASAPQNVFPQSSHAALAGYPVPGTQEGGRSKRRKGAAIGGAILAVAIIGGVAASQNTHKPGTSSGVGYNNPSTLEDALTEMVNDRLSDSSGQYYAPGVTVTDDLCVLQTGHTFTCVVTTSDGDSMSDDVVVTADGKDYVTK